MANSHSGATWRRGEQWEVGETGAQLLWGQDLEQGLGLATASGIAPLPTPNRGPEARSWAAARASWAQGQGLGARQDERHHQGQHCLKDVLVILDCLHCILDHGKLDLHLPLKEGEEHPEVLVIHPVHLLGFMPGLTLFKLGLRDGDQPLEESCLVLALVLMEPAH